MNCGGCGHSARAGSCKLAFVFDAEGSGLIRRRICASCIKTAVLIVAKTATGESELLTQKEIETREVLRGLARYLRKLARAYRAVLPGQLTIVGDVAPDGYRVAGLEAAADIADGWAARPETRKVEP